MKYRQCHNSLVLGQTHSGSTTHYLLSRRNHNQNWLSIEAGMRHPAAELTAFLAKGTWVAKYMSCQVTYRFTLFKLHLVLHTASTAPAWPVKCFAAALLLTKKSLKKELQRGSLSIYKTAYYFPFKFEDQFIHKKNCMKTFTNLSLK